MSFWWWASCMLVAALGFVLWPLVAKRPRGAAPVQQVAQLRANADLRAIYRDRLAELDEEVAAGQLDPTARAAVADEIGAALLADHGAAPPERVAAVDAPAPLFAATLGAALVLVALAVYWQVGEPRAGDVQGAEIVLRLNPDTDAYKVFDHNC